MTAGTGPAAGPVGAVGLVGLGTMGSALALRLAEGGWHVFATSLSARSREAVAGRLGITVLEDGASVTAALAGLSASAAQAGPSPSAAQAGLAPSADLIVLVSVPAGAQVAAVVEQPGGLLAGVPDGRRLLLVDTSTCRPEDSRALAERLAARGHRALDAPVSGGPTGARDGTLSIMVGGPSDALDAARPVLSALAGRITHCGGSGAGQLAKAANQLVVACTVQAVAEALALAAAHGLDPATVREALLGGYAASRVLELQGGRMIRADFTPGGSIALLAKDVDIIQELAGAAGVAVPALAATAGQVHRLAAAQPELDHSALITLLATAGWPG